MTSLSVDVGLQPPALRRSSVRQAVRRRVRAGAQRVALRVLRSDESRPTTVPAAVPHFARQRAQIAGQLEQALVAAGIDWQVEPRPWGDRPRWHLDATPAAVWRALAHQQSHHHSPDAAPLVARTWTAPRGARARQHLALCRLLSADFAETHLGDIRLGAPQPISGPAPRSRRWVVSRPSGPAALETRLAVETGVELSFGTSPVRAPVITFPVDLVYTWVDASDPEWQQDRLDHPAHGSELVAASSADARFVQHDELRYSLRSAEEFAPWVRHIWVVTSGQRPDWLLDHPKVSVVTHKEIWPDPSELPVFNSHAIETNLHRIPGLAEHYLYLNDDMFFGRPVSPETFFTLDGRPRVFPSRHRIPDGPPSRSDRGPDAAGKNNRALVQRLTGRRVDTKFQHTPYALSRSLVEELESLLPETFAATSASRYRSTSDVTVSGGLHDSYGLATGQAVAGTLRYNYVDLDRDHAAAALEAIVEFRYAEAFCLNAVESTPDPEPLARMLADYFRYPADWEAAGPAAPSSGRSNCDRNG